LVNLLELSIVFVHLRGHTFRCTEMLRLSRYDVTCRCDVLLSDTAAHHYFFTYRDNNSCSRSSALSATASKQLAL